MTTEAAHREPGSIERTTREVFEDHLRRAVEGDLDGDIATNFAADVVLLTGIGVLHGHEGVRRSRSVLHDDLPGGRYEYLSRFVERDYALLEWRGESDGVRIEDGADGFLIVDGLIRAQWIHYTVMHKAGYQRPIEHDRDERGAAG